MPKWIVNPATPRPCPMRLESIREAAEEKWRDTAIDEVDIFNWVCAGCPNLRGTLLNAATREPPLPGQGVADPSLFVDQLLDVGIFLTYGKFDQA